jgi:hypothetical protein
MVPSDDFRAAPPGGPPNLEMTIKVLDLRCRA